MGKKRLGQVVMEDGRQGTVSVERGDDGTVTITTYDYTPNDGLWVQRFAPTTDEYGRGQE